MERPAAYPPPTTTTTHTHTPMQQKERNCLGVPLIYRSVAVALSCRYAYADTPCFYKRCAVYANDLPLTPFLHFWD